ELQVGQPAATAADPAQDLQHPPRPGEASGPAAAGLILRKPLEVDAEGDDAVRIVQYYEPTRAHQAAALTIGAGPYGSARIPSRDDALAGHARLDAPELTPSL